MRVRNILALVGLAIGLSTVSVMTQSANDVRRELIDCPSSQIPEAYRSYKMWNKDHVGRRPVVSEIYSRDPEVAKARVRMYTRPSNDLKVKRGYFRLMTLLAWAGFTAPGTPQENAASMPPEQFLHDLENSNLHYRIVPCGSTRLKDLSEAEPDKEESGLPIPQVRLIPGFWVVNWCEKDVVVPDGPHKGECGITVVETDPILIKSDTNEGNTLVTRFILECGNPDMSIVELDEHVEVPKPPGFGLMAWPSLVTLPMIIIPTGNQLPAPERITSTGNAEIPKNKGWPSWLCGNKKSGTVCGVIATSFAIYAAKQGGSTAVETAGNQTGVKNK